jgi:RNA polymerase primary sigma factor
MKKINKTAEENDAMEIYYAEIRKRPLLSDDEEKMLATRIALGDKNARDTLVSRNLRFVVKIARRYESIMKNYFTGITLDDLVQEGNLGLIRAAERYSSKHGAKFSTYAVQWIHQRILRSFTQQNRAIRLSNNAVHSITKYNKVIEELTSKFSREPTDAEIATMLGIKTNKLSKIQFASQQIESLDYIIDPKTGFTIADMVADTQSPTVEEEVERKILMENLAAQIENTFNEALDGKKRKIMYERFGFNEEKVPKTLEEIGLEMGVTRERVRQIQAQALTKLNYKNYKPNAETSDKPNYESNNETNETKSIDF